MRFKSLLIILIAVNITIPLHSQEPNWIKAGTNFFNDASHFKVDTNNNMFVFYGSARAHVVDIQSGNLKHMIQTSPTFNPFFNHEKSEMYTIKDDTLEIWDIENFTLIKRHILKNENNNNFILTYTVDKRLIYDINFEDGLLAAYGESEKDAPYESVHIWDLNTGDFIKKLPLNSNFIDCNGISIMDSLIIYHDGAYLHIYDLKKQEYVLKKDLKYFSDYFGVIKDLDYAAIELDYPSKDFINKCKIMNLKNWELVDEFELSYLNTQFTFLSEENLIAYIDTTHRGVVIRDFNKKEIISRFSVDLFQPTTLNFIDGNYIVVSQQKSGLSAIYDFDGILVETLVAYHDEVDYMKFSNDGKFLGIISDDEGRVSILNPENGELLYSSTLPYGIGSLELIFSHDNRYLYCYGPNNPVVFWDFRKNEFSKVDETDYIDDLAFSKDGKFFAASSHDDRKIRIYDYKTKELLKVSETLDNYVTELVFDDNNIVVGLSVDDYNGYNPTLIKWNPQTNIIEEDNNAFIPPLAPRTVVNSSLNMNYIITPNSIWDIAREKSIETPDFERGVWSLDISNDGRYAAMASGGYSAEDPTSFSIFDIVNDKRYKLDFHDYVNYIGDEPFSIQNCATISPDGKTIISGTEDGNLISWPNPSLTSVNLNNASNSNDVTLYPNPASKKVSLEFKSQENFLISINLFSKNGEFLKTFNKSGNLSSYLLRLDISDLANGLYFLEIKTRKYKTTKKLFIVK